VKWEFVREIPAVLQACSESRGELLKTYRCIMDARPFYLSYKLDTIYVRRHCLLALSASVDWLLTTMQLTTPSPDF
jgi:hypothetical protein